MRIFQESAKNALGSSVLLSDVPLQFRPEIPSWMEGLEIEENFAISGSKQTQTELASLLRWKTQTVTLRAVMLFEIFDRICTFNRETMKHEFLLPSVQGIKARKVESYDRILLYEYVFAFCRKNGILLPEDWRNGYFYDEKAINTQVLEFFEGVGYHPGFLLREALAAKRALGALSEKAIAECIATHKTPREFVTIDKTFELERLRNAWSHNPNAQPKPIYSHAIAEFIFDSVLEIIGENSVIYTDILPKILPIKRMAIARTHLIAMTLGAIYGRFPFISQKAFQKSYGRYVEHKNKAEFSIRRLFFIEGLRIASEIALKKASDDDGRLIALSFTATALGFIPSSARLSYIPYKSRRFDVSKGGFRDILASSNERAVYFLENDPLVATNNPDKSLTVRGTNGKSLIDSQQTLNISYYCGEAELAVASVPKFAWRIENFPSTFATIFEKVFDIPGKEVVAPAITEKLQAIRSTNEHFFIVMDYVVDENVFSAESETMLRIRIIGENSKHFPHELPQMFGIPNMYCINTYKRRYRDGVLDVRVKLQLAEWAIWLMRMYNAPDPVNTLKTAYRI